MKSLMSSLPCPLGVLPPMSHERDLVCWNGPLLSIHRANPHEGDNAQWAGCKAWLWCWVDQDIDLKHPERGQSHWLVFWVADHDLQQLEASELSLFHLILPRTPFVFLVDQDNRGDVVAIQRVFSCLLPQDYLPEEDFMLKE